MSIFPLRHLEANTTVLVSFLHEGEYLPILKGERRKV